MGRNREVSDFPSGLSAANVSFMNRFSPAETWCGTGAQSGVKMNGTRLFTHPVK